MKLYIVGFGPGNYDSMTMEACSVIERCGLVVGYTTYTDILKKYFPHKEFYFNSYEKGNGPRQICIGKGFGGY